MILFIKNSRIEFMLFEQKSRGKSNVEILACPYICLTTLYFFIKISSQISCASNNTEGVLTVSQTAETPSGGSIQFPSFFIFFEK